MPKAKVENIKQDGAGWERVTVDVGQPDGSTKPAVYRRPDTETLSTLLVAGGNDKVNLSQFFPDYAGDAADETVAQFITRMFRVALDKRARQDAYEAAQAESTYITVGKERKNLMEISPEKFIKAFNGIKAQVESRADLLGGDAEAIASAEKSVGYGPWRVAARKMTEEKKVKMDEATGMLVAA